MGKHSTIYTVFFTTQEIPNCITDTMDALSILHHNNVIPDLLLFLTFPKINNYEMFKKKPPNTYEHFGVIVYHHQSNNTTMIIEIKDDSAHTGQGNIKEFEKIKKTKSEDNNCGDGLVQKVKQTGQFLHNVSNLRENGLEISSGGVSREDTIVSLRMLKVEADIGMLNGKTSSLEKAISDVRDDVKTINNKTNKLKKTLNDVKDGVKTLNKKTDDLDKMMNKKTDDLVKMMNKRFSKIEKDMKSMHDSLSPQLTIIIQHLKIPSLTKPDVEPKDTEEKKDFH